MKVRSKRTTILFLVVLFSLGFFDIFGFLESERGEKYMNTDDLYDADLNLPDLERLRDNNTEAVDGVLV